METPKRCRQVTIVGCRSFPLRTALGMLLETCMPRGPTGLRLRFEPALDVIVTALQVIQRTSSSPFNMGVRIGKRKGHCHRFCARSDELDAEWMVLSNGPSRLAIGAETNLATMVTATEDPYVSLLTWVAFPLASYEYWSCFEVVHLSYFFCQLI